MPDVRNKYGAFTREFMDDLAPHSQAINKAVRDLTDKGYKECEVFAVLVDEVSVRFATRRIKRGRELRMKEREQDV
tara:strand:- start:774 stop:1001 length:228 start_codon:yes stop_codon:yes gene_type:complete